MFQCKNCKVSFRQRGSELIGFKGHDEAPEIDPNDSCPTCGGIIEPGFYRKPQLVHCASGDIVIENVAMGVAIDQIPEAMKAYPGSEYNERGNLITKGVRQQEKEAARRGLIVK